MKFSFSKKEFHNQKMIEFFKLKRRPETGKISSDSNFNTQRSENLFFFLFFKKSMKIEIKYFNACITTLFC